MKNCVCGFKEVMGDVKKFGFFSVCAPQLSGNKLFAPPPPPPPPPDARAIFLHDELLCNGTCSVTSGTHNVLGGGGGTNGKDPKILIAKIVFLGVHGLGYDIYHSVHTICIFDKIDGEFIVVELDRKLTGQIWISQEDSI